MIRVEGGPEAAADSLAKWKEDLLERMLRWAALLVGVAWVAGTGAALWNGIWALAISNTVAFGVLLALAFLPGLPFRVRAWGLLGITFAVGISLVFLVGPLGAATVWLTAVPVLASFLFGLRGAVVGLAATATVLLILAWPAAAGWMGTVPLASGEMSTGYDLPSWLANAGSILGVGALLALPFAFLLDRAERARVRERDARLALEAAALEREALEARVRRTEKLEALGTFAGGIAHDFNNLLVPIMAEAEEILLLSPRESPEAEGAERILGAARRAGGLVRSILAFARGDQGPAEPLAPGPVLREVSVYLGRMLPPGVHLHVHDGSGDLRVLANGEQLHRVLMNLATNGVHAMETTGGTLGLSALATAEGVTFQVRDSGVGMDADTLARAVDPFFTTRRAGRGSGLGLSTVHGIVEGLGGHLHLHSRPGEGTVAEFRLPAFRSAAAAEPVATPASAPTTDPALESPPASAPAPDQASTAAPVRNAPLRILLVDDDPRVRTTLRRLLERMGMEVVEAAHGVEALARGARTRVDAGPSPEPAPWHLVLTDHTMPGMDGVELARHLAVAWPTLPVLLATGHVERALGDQDAEGLFAGVLRKPFGRQELEDAVQGALAGRGEPPGPETATTGRFPR